MWSGRGGRGGWGLAEGPEVCRVFMMGCVGEAGWVCRAVLGRGESRLGAELVLWVLVVWGCGWVVEWE